MTMSRGESWFWLFWQETNLVSPLRLIPALILENSLGLNCSVDLHTMCCFSTLCTKGFLKAPQIAQKNTECSFDTAIWHFSVLQTAVIWLKTLKRLFKVMPSMNHVGSPKNLSVCWMFNFERDSPKYFNERLRQRGWSEVCVSVPPLDAHV